ncbi:MAG: methionine synthase [Bdellovibrionales bacterium]|nr:methionine synthase [Bdellovibrionales bacterium]
MSASTPVIQGSDRLPWAPDRAARIEALLHALGQRVLVLDGAMGTALQDRDLSAEDFGGVETEGCNELLVLTRPDVVREIHEDYLRAGADIVETDTFGGTPLVLAEFGVQERTQEINLAAARLAREACAKFETPTRPRWVAGAIGPTTKAITVTGGVTFEELVGTFHAQAAGLYDGGCDYLLIETAQDGRNIKAALLGIDRLFEERGARIPIAVSGTVEPMGTLLAGQSAEALFASLAHRDLLYLGLNCATGPEFMTDHIRSLARLSPFRVACVPNAGLPDEDGHYLETPQMVCGVVGRFLENGWLNLVGGCCGTHRGHVSALAKLVERAKPRALARETRSFLSGVDYVEITDDVRPVLVGERANVIGSRAFKRLIVEGRLDEAAEIAAAQVRGGAQILDVCLANPDRDEDADMRAFMELLCRRIRIPFMIDSTDEKVIETALTYCQGKAIVNSVNLEDGEERFEKVVPLARRYGAALVVGTIDDHPTQSMGVTRERKLEIARREYGLLTGRYGFRAEDIYWDPLTFPCATGDAQYVGSALETIEALRMLKAEFPGTRTVLGVSNVSFGLPAAGREVLNSVFLYHCVQAGLDLAIVNTEKLERYATIPEEEKELADNLLFNRGEDPIAAFAARFRDRAERKRVSNDDLPLDERLARAVVEGRKDSLGADLTEALKERRPLEIINGPLMKGMDEVGRLFNANQLIVAEVLQSAEVMKSAVAFLEPRMEKAAAQSARGKVLLATVKGDVHDIGKNLVDIILTNNGFEVVNLGIKVPPEKLIEAVRSHRPDLLGLSGLLVKSAQQMVITADDLSRAEISVPILVGGAALTENFVDKRIAQAYTTGTVAYAKDAMHGLDLARSIVEPGRFETLKADLAKRRAEKAARPAVEAPAAPAHTPGRDAGLALVDRPPRPPDLERHVLRSTPVEQLWKFINPLMLYGRHLGIPGKIVRRLEKAGVDPALRKELLDAEPKALRVWEAVQEVMREVSREEILKPAAVYQFFRARAEGDALHLLRSDGGAPPLTSFRFPRQKRAGGLCLADYVREEAEAADTVALFTVTAGRGVRARAEEMKERGEYLKSHILQALAIETAEAYAEWLHAQLRRMWGFADPPEMTHMERFQTKYRGKRYSFGYPACPRLDDQAPLFELLRPKEIGVELTDGYMMDPEASVSAIVFHHPEATYYSVGDAEGSNRE